MSGITEQGKSAPALPAECSHLLFKVCVKRQ